MAVLKREVQDDNEEALVPTPKSSIRKVPSISDLSDPDVSLGKYLVIFYFYDKVETWQIIQYNEFVLNDVKIKVISSWNKPPILKIKILERLWN